MKKFLLGLTTLLMTVSAAFAANAPVIFGPGNSAQFLVPALMPPDTNTPPNPPANYHKMYIKSDDNLYILNSAGVETMVGTGGGGGTVTSVALALPASVFSVAGSPVINTGTLTGSFINQNANRVFAGPSVGGAAAPTFRALVAADIPSLDFSKITTGVVPIAQGGTGQATAVAGFDALAPTTTKGDLIVHDGTDNIRVPVGADTFVLTADSSQASGVRWAAGGGGGSGTVTSVDFAAPAEFTVSGNPVTTAGTITLTKANQAANIVYAGPSAGGAAAPSFRALVAADIPALDFAKITTGIVPIAQGGTNAATAVAGFNNLSPLTTKGDLLSHDGTDNVRVAVGTDGQMLVADSGAAEGVSWANPPVGTVTSVDLAVPGIFTLAGNPITSSGTITVGLANEAINTVWAGPAAGGAAAPTFRALVSNDIPALDFSKITTGIVPVAQGGTGQDFSADTGLVKVAAGTMSVSALVDADVDPAAAIDRTKLAAAPTNTFAYFDNSGFLSNIPGWSVSLTNGAFGQNTLQTVTVPVAAGFQKVNSMEAEMDAANSTAGYDAQVYSWDFHYDRTGSGGNAGNIVSRGSSATMEGNGTLNQFWGESSNITLGVGANTGTVTQGLGRQGSLTVGPGFTVVDLQGENFGITTNATSVVTNVQGENRSMNIGGPLTGNYNALVQDVNLNTVAGSVTMERRNINSGTITGDVFMDVNSINADGANFTGKSVSVTGNFTTARGFQANMSGAALPGGASPVAFEGNNGTIQINANIPIQNAAGVQVGNTINAQTNIVNGSPASGTDFMSFAMPAALFADDDLTASGPIGWGWAATGYVGQLGVTAGHTVDSLAMNIAGASYPVSSTGGTVTEASLYYGLGFISAGGTLNFGTVNLLKGSSFMCSGATNCYAVNAPDAAAQGLFGGALRSNTSLLLEDPGAGTNAITIQSPTLAAAYTLTLPVDAGTNGYVLSTDGAGVLSWIANSGGGGTVTSVDLAVPAEFTVSGNPITGAGTITISKATQAANIVYAGPAAGGAVAPTFRALVSADIPNLDFAKITTGVVPIAQGGTGQATALAGFNALSPLTTKGDLLVHDGTDNVRLPVGADGEVLVADSAAPEGVSWQAAGSGTVTSVALTVPGFLSVAGSPVTTSGTLAVSLANQNANLVFAGPAAAGPAAPTFRSLVAADLPLVSLTTGVTGTLPIGNGGTGQTTATAAFDALAPTTTKGDLITRNGTNNIRQAVGADGQILIADSTQASGLRWGSNSAVVSATTGFEPEVFVLNGGVTFADAFDGLRRAENAKTIAKIVVCALETGLSGNTTVRVRYGAALGSSTTLNLPGAGGPGCASSTPAIALSTNDLMAVDLTAVAGGAPQNLSVKLLF